MTAERNLDSDRPNPTLDSETWGLYQQAAKTCRLCQGEGSHPAWMP